MLNLTQTRSTKGFTLLETIVALAIFAQMTVMVGSAVILALQYNQFNKATRIVNLELYSIMVHGIGSYLRAGTGIMYADTAPTDLTQRDGTITNTSAGQDSFERTCESGKVQAFDRLTLYQDRRQQSWITFGVEQSTENNTSRLVWHRGWRDSAGAPHVGNDFYLNSEDTYITCFLVSPSTDPSSNLVARDVQPFVKLALAARDRNSFLTESETLLAQNTEIAYQSIYTLRNYNLSSL